MRLCGKYFALVIIALCLTTLLGCRNDDDDKAEKGRRGTAATTVSALIKRLIYSEEKVKYEARKELATLDKDAKARLLPELVVALKYKRTGDPNEVVYRYRAAETLGLLGPIAKETGPDLIDAMKNDESDLVRTDAALAIAKIDMRPEMSVPVLIAALSDGQISDKVASALAEIGRPAVPALISALANDNVHIRHQAAEALAKMGPIANDAAPALLNALKSTSDGRLKNKFADALKRIGPAAGEDLSTLIQDLRNSDNGIRFSAINALAAKGESAAPVVVKLLADPDKDVRFWSAYLLARHKSSSDGIAVALEKALKDSDQCVRGNVMWALREASPVRVSSHDISDDELAAIDRIVTMKPTDEDIIIHSIYRLDGLKTVFPASVKMDHILFKSGLAKVAVGEMLAETNHKSPVLETYNETHKDDYIVFLGVMYKGGDFKALIEKYPKSPLAADAAYLMARENTKVGECEGDMSCELRSSIGIFISYLRDYPTHSKVGSVVEDINKTVSSLSQDPSRGGLLELFEIDESGGLIKEYHEVVKSLPNPDMRGDALYLLARAYISAAQFEKADQLYSELEANYPKYHNARATAAYQFFDYSEKPSQDKLLHIEELVRLTAPLSDPSEMKRLDALERINHADIKERPLLFSLLLKIGMLSQKDDSPAVRKHAIGAIGALASNTSFFRSVVGYCISHDEDKKNQQYCADLGVNHPNLKSTEFYAFNRDRINENLTEATGKPYPSPEQLAEWRETAIRRDREATSTIVQQATAQRITIFGKEYIIIRNKFRPERVVPLYIAMMLLCGLYCYKIAQRRSADKRFWFIVGMLTAPVSLSYILFIPQRSPK